MCSKMWDVAVGSECISWSKQGALQSVESGWCPARCGTLQSEVGGVQHNMRYETVGTEWKACSKQGAFHSVQNG